MWSVNQLGFSLTPLVPAKASTSSRGYGDHVEHPMESSRGPMGTAWGPFWGVAPAKAHRQLRLHPLATARQAQASGWPGTATPTACGGRRGRARPECAQSPSTAPTDLVKVKRPLHMRPESCLRRGLSKQKESAGFFFLLLFFLELLFTRYGLWVFCCVCMF